MPGLKRAGSLHELALLEVLYRQMDVEDVSQQTLELLLAEILGLVQFSSSSSSSSSFLLECIIFVNFVVQDPSLPFPPNLFRQLFLSLLRVALWAGRNSSARREEEGEDVEQDDERKKKAADAQAQRAVLCQTALEAAYLASAGEQAEALFEEETMKVVSETVCAMMEEENAKSRELACYLVQNVVLATKNHLDKLEFNEGMSEELLLRFDDSADAVRTASLLAMECLLENRKISDGNEQRRLDTIKKKISETLEDPQVSEEMSEICRRLLHFSHAKKKKWCFALQSAIIELCYTHGIHVKSLKWGEGQRNEKMKIDR
eukprot:747196-Hanusia_phi.AAC.2